MGAGDQRLRSKALIPQGRNPTGGTLGHPARGAGRFSSWPLGSNTARFDTPGLPHFTSLNFSFSICFGEKLDGFLRLGAEKRQLDSENRANSGTVSPTGEGGPSDGGGAVIQ